MNELSVARKAARYDQAVEKAKNLLKVIGDTTLGNLVLKNEFENMFPELAELEDERIRKALIWGFKAMAQESETFANVPIGSCIAYLEKQREQKHTPKHKIGDTIYYNSFGEVKSMVVSDVVIDSTDDPMYEDKEGNAVFEKDIIEQKPADKSDVLMSLDEAIEHCKEKSCSNNACALEHRQLGEWLIELKELKEQKLSDKVEPKFKQGDWIIFNGHTLNVKQVVKGFYIATDKDGITNGYDWSIDNVARLWTIQQDVRDGDVLAVNNEVFIYAHRKQMYSIAVAHCFVDSASCFYFDGEFGYTEKGNSIHPATKEQRDTLMKAMTNAGYTFDFEKKELKKIEQKSAEWSEEEEGYFKSIAQALSVLLVDPSSDKIKLEHTAWFHSLKDRVQSQSTWKPSDGQLECLGYAIEKAEKDWSPLTNNRIYLTLKALKEQLKKLRVE